MDNRSILINRIITIAVAIVMLVVLGIFGYMYYNANLKPVTTIEQTKQGNMYSFTARCKPQEPILGIYKDWLFNLSKLASAHDKAQNVPDKDLSDKDRQNIALYEKNKEVVEAARGEPAFTYNIACFVERQEDIRELPGTQPTFLGKPKPGMILLKVSDSKPLVWIDWEKDCRDNNKTPAECNKLPAISLFGLAQMRFYLYPLTQEFRDNGGYANFLCSEGIDKRGYPNDPAMWRPVYWCAGK